MSKRIPDKVCEKCNKKALYEIELKSGRASLRCRKHRFAGTGRLRAIQYLIGEIN